MRRSETTLPELAGAKRSGTPEPQDPAASDFRKKYHVIAQLGQGGMALVHLAVVRGMAGVRKLVVLKSIRPDLVVNREIREMFLTEARLAAMLNHPNIVQTYEVAMIGGRPMLVMEYLDGQPLARVLNEQASRELPLSMQLFVLKEILSGLDHVHTLTDLDGTPLNLVHRDVSPQNVFVTYEGQVKLLDFGIAKKMGTGDTETGVVKGKIRYMPPEQVVASAMLDRRADLFSVGVMLWEALTGHRMWESCSDLQIMNALSSGKIPTPSSAAPNVPSALEGVCMRALAPNADDRYASASAMQADLERVVQELRLETTQRHVSKLVAQWFADTRSTTRNTIEAQLKDPSASMVNLMVGDDGGLPSQSAAGTAHLWNVPSTPSLSTSPETPRSRSRFNLRWAAAALLGLAIAGTLSFHFANRSGEATPVPSAPASAPPDAKLVHVSIEAAPATARLYLDDSPLTTNPFEGSLPRDTAQHKLRAEAPGYLTQTLVVGLTDELTLKVELESASVGAQQPSSRTVKGTSTFQAHSGSVTGAKARPQCNPPFYLDADGIKHPKAECMR